jgi:predicted phage terminase large subunit-like protein
MNKNAGAQAVEDAYYEDPEDEQVVLGPCSVKQREVLMDDDTSMLLVGGGAGGGKTYLALLKALKFCDDPAAKVLIVRLSYPAIKAIGGLVDESQYIYPQFGAEWRVQPLEWRFPNGAIIKFCAMPTNIKEVQGWQATNIIVDEGAEFQLADILALKERLRGARYKGKLSMTITCNPDRNSWLYPFVEYCLDEYGVPKPNTEDITRWFIVRDGKVLWGDTVDALFEEHGHGLNRDPAKGKVTYRPTSFRFIPMDIYSNPVLLKNNPDYLANLLSGTRVSQLRFLHGSWTAVPEGASVFNRDWIKIVDHPPVNPAQKVRSWDVAHSVPSETYPNPDWTSGTLMSRTKFGTYCIEDVKRFRKLTDGVIKEIIEISCNVDGRDIQVTFPKDNGGGKAASMFFLRAFAEAGMSVRGVAISGHSSKMQRFLPFCTLAESGCVTMVRGDWNEAFLTELEYFDGTRNLKDDQVDSTADAFNTLAKQTTIPSFSVPDMSMPSPIPRI